MTIVERVSGLRVHRDHPYRGARPGGVCVLREYANDRQMQNLGERNDSRGSARSYSQTMPHKVFERDVLIDGDGYVPRHRLTRRGDGFRGLGDELVVGSQYLDTKSAR